MPTPQEATLSSLTELLARVDIAAQGAMTHYTELAKVQREITRTRAALATLVAEGTASANVLGFATNVQHALDGLDLALLEVSRAVLAVQGARGSFAAQTKGWHDAALTPTASRT